MRVVTGVLVFLGGAIATFLLTCVCILIYIDTAKQWDNFQRTQEYLDARDNCGK